MCIDYAVSHSIELSSLDVQCRDAVIDVNIERGKFLPTINAKVINGISMGFQQVLTKEMAGKYESVSSYNNALLLSVSMPVWSADAQLLSLKLKRKNAEIINEQKAEKILDLKTNVVQKFYAVTLAKNRVAVVKKQLEQQDYVLQVSKRMFELGIRAQKDVLDAELNREQDRYTLLQEQNTYEKTIIELANVMGYKGPFETVDSVADEKNPFYLSLTDACNSLFLRHPSTRVANMQIETVNMQRKIVQRQRYPSLLINYEAGTNGISFFSQPNTTLSSQWRNNAYQAALLTLQIPIFNRGDVKNQLKKVDMTAERMSLALQNAKKTIRDNLQVMMTDIKQSEKMLVQAKETESIAERQFAKAMKDYKLGNIPSYELNTYKSKRTSAQLQSVQAEIELRYKKQLLQTIFE